MANDPLFLTTLGREFAKAVSDTGIEASGQDAYEVFANGLRSPIDYGTLSSLSSADVERIRAACDAYFEQQGVTSEHIRNAVENTLRHWT